MAQKVMRVAATPLWTPGGPGRLRDAVQLNPWVFLSLKFMWWCIIHPVHIGAIVLGLAALILVGWQLSVILLVSIVVFFACVRVGWAAQGCSPASLIILVCGYWHLRKVQRRWPDCCEAANVLSRGTRRVVPVRRWRITPTGVSVVARVGKCGRTVEEMSKGSSGLEAVVGATSVDVTRVANGLALVSLSWGDSTAKVLTVADLPGSPNGYASFGREAGGESIHVSLYTSLLMVGETGSGKSNIIWALIASLLQDNIPFRIRVIDPAGGVEMALLENAPYCTAYTDKAKGADALITQARDSMMARLHDMKTRQVRKHVPSEAEPLDITIIDEILLLGDMLKKGVTSPMGEILSTGRKAGYIVWGLSQLGQVDALGRIRDLFAQRICLATKSREMTEAVLGPSAEAEGARCSKIPASTPGVGYLYINGIRGYRKFRAVFISDANTEELAMGIVPSAFKGNTELTHVDDVLASRKTARYMLYNTDGRLLYVGITVNPNTRFGEHATERIWWDQVDMSRTVITWYPNRKKAKAQETKAIRTLHPIYNVSEVEDGEATG
jgi:S-DNA-T family DNA segregation ATPase FtsK/SpoIIIE